MDSNGANPDARDKAALRCALMLGMELETTPKHHFSFGTNYVTLYERGGVQRVYRGRTMYSCAWVFLASKGMGIDAEGKAIEIGEPPNFTVEASKWTPVGVSAYGRLAIRADAHERGPD
jgi:hypothetical protein